MTDSLLESTIDTALAAGREILSHYGRALVVEPKADESPLTHADRASHQCIVTALGRMAPDVPVLSEESAPEEFAARKRWERFWLVDPLDGTKEFLKQTGEFTVNIALVDGEDPSLGVIHVPVSGVTYVARRGGGAFVIDAGGARRAIRTRRADLARPVIVASRDHAGPRVEAFLARVASAETTSLGSSLKFCLIAEGRADFYPRLVPTFEWDTAAAQCVVEEAGGRVVDTSGRPIRYNKDDLRNPPLLAFGDPRVDWRAFMAPELARTS